MSSYEYRQILQFLYFEGYADSYESAEYLFEQLTEEEYVELCERATRPTRLPKSRERDIGHDDWKDSDPDSRDWGERPEGAKKLRRRLTATVGTQRRQDIETGVRKEAHSFIAQYLHDEGYADTIESAELMVENISDEWVEEILDEANKWEKKSGIGGKSPESELSRTRSRAFHTGSVGSKGSKNTVNPSDIDSGTLLMNRQMARMLHKRNRGKSPSDPTYRHRRKIDPLKIPSYRESPLGFPKGYKEPLKSRSNNKSPSKVGDKVNANIKPLQTKDSVDAKSNIRKFKREDLEYILDTLISEGFAVDYDSAGCILEAMSDEWAIQILESEDSNWNAVRKSASRRKPSTGPIRVGREPVLKSSDVTPPDPEVTERRKKRAKRLNFEVK